MGSGGQGGGGATAPPGWSVYDGIKTIPSSTPDFLMAEINTAMSSLEYSRATTFLHPSSSSSSSSTQGLPSQYDAQLADDAYKAGCAALASGKLDEALLSLQLSLSKCPPHKTSAISKLQSLITLTSRQIRKSPPVELV